MAPTLIEAATRKPVWKLPKDALQNPYSFSADGRVLLRFRHPESTQAH